jgi:pimeloyl-ACP methyl ester carboxylesterase
MITSCTISINDIKINIIERVGNSPAVLFIHGNSMSSKVWQKQFASNSLKEYHLLAIDLPGHGNSAYSHNPDIDYNIPTYSFIVNQIISQLNLKQYLLVGYSLGGNIVAEALPGLNSCSGVAIISSTIVARPAALDKAILPNPAANALFTAHPSASEIEHLLQTYFSKNHTSMPDFLFEDFLATDPNCRRYISQSVMEGNHADEIQILQNSSIPIALISGEKDKIINNEYFSNLAVPKWKEALQTIPQAGHIPQWENDERFNDLLVEFIHYCTK